MNRRRWLTALAVLTAPSLVFGDTLLGVVADFSTTTFVFKFYDPTQGAGIVNNFESSSRHFPGGWVIVGGVPADARHLPNQHVFLQYDNVANAPAVGGCITLTVTLSRARVDATPVFTGSPDFTRSCFDQELFQRPPASATQSVDVCTPGHGQLDVSLDFEGQRGGVGVGYVGYISTATVVQETTVLAQTSDCLQIFWGN